MVNMLFGREILFSKYSKLDR